MNKIFLLIVMLIAVAAVFAQNPVAKGQTQFNAGFGFSSWGVPIYLGLDYGVHKDVTMGGEFSFKSFREKLHDEHYKHSVIGISGNANYHFNHVLKIPKNWDFYGGLNVGFYVWNSPDDYEGTHTSGLGLGAQIGGRYYFTESMGVNLELGGGNAFSSGKIGISIKL
ncbi:MAG: hypothetical protein Q8M98_05635 [Candidatus Cloacimonadaceae bacterium]|nr:hypothetical protein [Candidatus Cloacimonadaceae bacterium]MDP3114243.1 hypothetical protein [Candidatus Cloacimonadaceae bacterium]